MSQNIKLHLSLLEASTDLKLSKNIIYHGELQ